MEKREGFDYLAAQLERLGRDWETPSVPCCTPVTSMLKECTSLPLEAEECTYQAGAAFGIEKPVAHRSSISLKLLEVFPDGEFAAGEIEPLRGVKPARLIRSTCHMFKLKAVETREPTVEKTPSTQPPLILRCKTGATQHHRKRKRPSGFAGQPKTDSSIGDRTKATLKKPDITHRRHIALKLPEISPSGEFPTEQIRKRKLGNPARSVNLLCRMQPLNTKSMETSKSESGGHFPVSLPAAPLQHEEGVAQHRGKERTPTETVAPQKTHSRTSKSTGHVFYIKLPEFQLKVGTVNPCDRKASKRQGQIWSGV
ncbi:hypothetical protein EOD39_5583 [Acipenser ruthenus]|uniref:Uncharacterized protein n=1 Tax=Acipenser ruthenus TaxID=7906 RepID=A0A444UDQ3_ACIRT|nr:hypothetical protein EOD39_5583 [Acipenser ruthenus]